MSRSYSFSWHEISWFPVWLLRTINISPTGMRLGFWMVKKHPVRGHHSEDIIISSLLPCRMYLGIFTIYPVKTYFAKCSIHGISEQLPHVIVKSMRGCLKTLKDSRTIAWARLGIFQSNPKVIWDCIRQSCSFLSSELSNPDGHNDIKIEHTGDSNSSKSDSIVTRQNKG